MKKSLQVPAVKIIALYSLFFIALPFLSLGQSKEKEEAERQMAQKLATLDLSGFKTDFLLNKGVFTESEIAYFRSRPRNKQGQIVMTTNAEDWQNLYERIVGADLRANGKGRVPDFGQFAEKNRLKQSKNNPAGPELHSGTVRHGVSNATIKKRYTLQAQSRN